MNAQTPNDPKPMTPAQGLTYLGELVSEYLKTLPAPVRVPVISAVNNVAAVVGARLQAADKMEEEIKKLQKKLKEPTVVE